MWRVWEWFVRVSLVFAGVCFLLGTISKFMPAQTVSSFLETGRHVAMASGFVYVNLSKPPTPAEKDLVRQMDELQAKSGRNGVHIRPISNQFITMASGDRWLMFGWEEKWQVRQVGPYSGTIDRRVGLWIWPWGGVLIGLVPGAIAWGILAWHRRVVRHRLEAGLCPACGYDLRASTERCPECGAAVPQKQNPVSQPRTV